MMTGRIEELDSWRAISVALVVVGHLAHYALVPSGMAPGDSPGSWLPELDVLGVHVFFCISGFIITRLALAERTRTGGFSVRGFWLRRACRILPALAVYLAAVVLLQLDGRIVQSWGQTARGAAFVCNLPGLGDCGWFTGHLWSLAVEQQFYLLFPLVFARLGNARFAGAVAAGWLALAAFPTLATIGGHGGRGLLAHPFTFLLAGVLLAVHEARLRQWLATRAAPAWWIALAVMAASLAQPDADPAGVAGWALRQALWLALPAAICVAIAVSLEHPGRLGRALRRPLPTTVGRMSYSLYLWQQLWFGWPDLYAGGSWLPSVALLPLVAWASWRWVEQPLARRGVRRTTTAPLGS